LQQQCNRSNKKNYATPAKTERATHQYCIVATTAAANAVNRTTKTQQLQQLQQVLQLQKMQNCKNRTGDKNCNTLKS
jgi:hypothetical protein